MDDASHVDILHYNILHHTASSPGAFEPQANVRADEQAVANSNCMDTSGHLAADHNASMSVIYRAIPDGNILTGHSPTYGLPHPCLT